LKLPLATRISLPIYFLLSVGVSLQISGSNWDIVWHGVGNVETFFTPPHLVIYFGVALATGSIIGGSVQTAFAIRQKKKAAKWLISVPLSFPFSLKLSAMGCIYSYVLDHLIFGGIISLDLMVCQVHLMLCLLLVC
jgi:hypothetical protein